ncbi:hypothetical protein BMJ22_14205 [Sinorhizobium medicae]|nr:hypothetical protein BMJ22_14205 [Sinorhizobium medicae]
MKINFVVSEDKSSRIFSDIFRRFIDSGQAAIVISEAPIDDADIYHYHRPQMEQSLKPNSVVTVHHDLDDIDPFVRFDRFADRYREASTIVCLNSIQQNKLAALGYRNTVVIPHGYDENLFAKSKPKAFPSSRKITIGMISKRYPRRFKGEVLFYELLDRLPTERFRFILVGEGRSKDSLYMSNLGFEVECHEIMPYRLFPSVYAEIDALLMCSTFEGGPANIPEAVASGTPVICTKIGMVPDMILDGMNGIHLTGRADRDAKRIIDWATNRDGDYDTLAKGANEVHSAPTWTEVINRHMTLYQHVLNKLSIVDLVWKDHNSTDPFLEPSSVGERAPVF